MRSDRRLRFRLVGVTGAGVLLGLASLAFSASQPSEQQIPRPSTSPGGPVDREGLPLPAGAIARMGTLRLRHGGNVHTLAFSPDGTKLASAGSDRPIRLWDVASGRELHQLHGRFHPITSLVFSADGKVLTSACTGVTLRSWDVATGKRLPTQHEADRSDGALLSPDGKMLALSEGYGDAPGLALWEIASAKKPRALQVAGKSQGVLAFSADGTWLASGHDGAHTIHIWETATGKQRRLLHKRSEPTLRRLAFSPDAKILASGGFGRIVLWDVTTGEELRYLSTQLASIWALAFSPDGSTLASGCNSFGAPVGGTITLWETATGKVRRELRGHHGGIGCLAFSPDGRVLASGGDDHTVRFWNVATGAELFPFEGHPGAIRHLALLPDGNVLAAGGDAVIRHWDTATGRELRRLEGHGANITALALSPGGKTLVSGGADGVMRRWQVATGKAVSAAKADQYGLCAIASSPDGRWLASGGADTLVRLWDAGAHRELRTLKGHTGCIASLAFSPESDIIVSAAARNDPAIRLWHAETGKEVRSLLRESAQLDALALSPDGKVLVGIDHTVIHVWEMDSGRQIWKLQTAGEHVHCVAFFPGDRILAAGCDRRIRFWDLATGKQIRTLEGHEGYVGALGVSADGTKLVSGAGDTTLLAWDLKDLAAPRGLAGDLWADALGALWTDLGAEDAERAHRAMWSLAGAGQPAVALLRERLRPVCDDPHERIGQLILDLDSATFAVRDRAMRELQRLGRAAELDLLKALDRSATLEFQRRIELLLGRMETSPAPALQGDLLRRVRAIRALEHAGGRDAQAVLEFLARRMPAGREAREARGALKRLAGRSVAD